MTEKDFVIKIKEAATAHIEAIRGKGANPFTTQERMYQMLSPFTVIEMADAWLEKQEKAE